MALLRLVAISLLCGGLLPLPFLDPQRRDGFAWARLDFLTLMEMAQIITVPLGVVAGVVLVATRTWTRPPGYVLAAVTTLFGLVVVTQGWPTMSWAESRPPGIGDPDGEVVVGMLAVFSGAVTALVGMAMAGCRWAEASTPPHQQRMSNPPL
ncbi:hypothetical protein [Nonomuraea roseoviolacea]|uniref:Uncharacterized protein n=1 Tax=Nonomuraea roseoviolacea subsp. carminata TaxID=160689 RepID=A0ABT1JZU2_9ACTN|nr:hypothetical protein [Nonomuraea roseoviolacea]MCP2347255.1 hypothetical protein [Nonomuraea roseoviolacea subsp. carminata]